MAIRRFGDYDKTQAYGDYQQLPKGGYVMKIMGAQICENSRGQYIKIGCDIAEGEYKGFYANEYKNQQKEDKKWHCNYLLNVPNDDGSDKDNKTKRWFRTFTDILEESNPGYHFDWDEQKFKGKLFGGLFNMRPYQKNDGSIGWITNLKRTCTVEKIRSGNFTLPDDDPVPGAPTPSNASAPSGDGWMNIPDGVDEQLPFD